MYLHSDTIYCHTVHKRKEVWYHESMNKTPRSLAYYGGHLVFLFVQHPFSTPPCPTLINPCGLVGLTLHPATGMGISQNLIRTFHPPAQRSPKVKNSLGPMAIRSVWNCYTVGMGTLLSLKLELWGYETGASILPQKEVLT